MAILISAAQQRFLVLASTIFFMMSLYICVSRLVQMSFEPMDLPRPEEQILHITVNKADSPMSYGGYKRPGYDGITLTRPFPEEYIPTKENSRRLILIGDIHGMLDPLNDLLKQVKFNPETDHIIAAGDTVNKGPKSHGVVKRLMEINATAVRGNHEDRVLLAWEEVKEKVGVDASLDSPHEQLRRGENLDLDTARSLTAAQIEWLKSLPVILTIEKMSMYVVHAGLVPGLDIEDQDPWAVMNMRTLRFPREELRLQEEGPPEEQQVQGQSPPIEEQTEQVKEEMSKHFIQKEQHKRDDRSKEDDEKVADFLREAAKEFDDNSGDQPTSTPAAATPSKATERDSEPSDLPASKSDKNPANFYSHPDHDIWIPVDTRDGEPWTILWNHWQRNMHASERRTIVYGHDAKRGYREEAYTYGLDSGCVKGNALTAMVITAGDKGGWKHTTTQIQCKKPKGTSWW